MNENNLATTQAPSLATTQAPSLAYGSVERMLRDTTQGVDFIDVRAGDVSHKAQRAKSCLVAPAVGDTVLCLTGGAGGGCFVLAVLASKDAQTRIAADGDLLLAAGGRVALSSAHGVDLATDGDLTMRATKASVVVEQLGYVGRVVEALVAERLALAADQVDATVDTLRTHARAAFRFVRELDVLRAGSIDARAEQLLQLHGENTVVTARTLAKVDGAQIHLG
jgi:hypothetical protein